MLGRVRAQALARLDQRGLVMHRLTQAIVRGLLPPDQAARCPDCGAGGPGGEPSGDQTLPSTWPGWAQLLPHLLASDLDATAAALKGLAEDAAWYLIHRGNAAAAMTWPAACTSTG